jgi:hypothetical protein
MTRFALFAAAILVPSVALAGAWGSGSFENDDALDWVQESVRAPSVAPVLAAFKETQAKYVEAPEGSRAVAAAEAVAAALGKPSPKIPPELRAWAERHRADLRALASVAQQAVARVLDRKSSELAQLWSAGKPGEKWPEAITDLQARLR